MIEDYWLNYKSFESENPFQNLESEDEEGSKKSNEKVEKIKKPPPIFVSDVENLCLLKELLDNKAKDQYTIKILSNNEVKIQVNIPEKFIPLLE